MGCQKEALEVFAQHLEVLLTKAMPELAGNLREQQLVDKFVEGLTHSAPAVARELGGFQYNADQGEGAASFGEAPADSSRKGGRKHGEICGRADER